MSNCDCDPFFVATLRVAIGAHTNKLRIAALPRFATLPIPKSRSAPLVSSISSSEKLQLGG